MNIVLLGIQGSGKGSLVEQLKSKFDFTVISAGDLLREETKSNTKLGNQVEKLINQGQFVDDGTIFSIVKKQLENAKDVVIFDGFPRNLSQAEVFDEEFGVDLVLNLNLSKEVAQERILNRLVCSTCGYITKKSDVSSNVCPVCGGKLETRADDTPKSIEARFETFDRVTSPLVARYSEKGVLYNIDASKTPLEVLEEAIKVIKNECNN